VALSQALYPRYSERDPYAMAAACIDSAVRQLVAVGADPTKIAILDNFCWCDSNNPARLGQLKEAARACYDLAVAYGTPFISGKDSMFNDFRGFDAEGQPLGISILPTLVVSSISVMAEAARAVSLDFKAAADILYLLGETRDELGGSEYFAYLSGGREGALGALVPQVDTGRNRPLYAALAGAMEAGLVSSAVSVGHGGLAVAVARAAMAGQLGAEVDLRGLPGGPTSDEAALFSESQGRLLVSVAPDDQRRFESAMAGHALVSVGSVSTARKLRFSGLAGQSLIDLPLEDALAAYRKTFGGW
jgi:phosphoribosylformylglycinamidine synthase subunit PurSL